MKAKAEHRPSLLRLFDQVWERLTERLALAEALGADWFAASTPFVTLHRGEVVAHVGVLSIDLVLEGAPTAVAGIHAVGTHPAYRERGLIRELLTEALSHVDAHHRTAQLTTEVPRVFRSHGFRSVPQCTWRVPRPASSAAPCVPLDHRRPEDVATLRRLLSLRSPLSHRLGVVEPGWLFIIDEVLCSRGLSRVHHCRDLDCLVVLEDEGRHLRVVDVVASDLPSLDALLARLPPSPHRGVELAFTPDRFAIESPPQPGAFGDLHVMVRGPYPPEEGGPFTLPELAHC